MVIRESYQSLVVAGSYWRIFRIEDDAVAYAIKFSKTGCLLKVNVYVDVFPLLVRVDWYIVNNSIVVDIEFYLPVSCPIFELRSGILFDLNI